MQDRTLVKTFATAMKKVGRNDPCPCGSGKKFKKCCLDTHMGLPPAASMADLMEKMKSGFFNRESHDPSGHFHALDNDSLLSLFALLQVLPENHGKNLRLEELQRMALRARPSSEGGDLDVPALREYVHLHYSHNTMEDPPENLFTENIMTPLGNRIVFAGITEGQLYTLQQFITVIGNPGLELPPMFREQAIGSVLLLLSICDQMARRLGYERNMVAKPDDDNQIYFPALDFVAQHLEAFRMSDRDVESLAKSIAVKPDLIDRFVVDQADENLAIDHSEDNPLLFRPLLRNGSTIHILSPASIVFACVNTIIALATEHGCLSELLAHYSKASWHQCQFMLDEIGFAQLQQEPPTTTLPIREGLFRFDTDKVAYVLLQHDSGNDYDVRRPFTYYFDQALNERIQERRKEVFELIRNDPKYANDQLYNINLFLGIGRPTKHSFGATSPSWRVIGFYVPDLQVLYRSDKCHNLTLWNYTEAYAASGIDTPFFLDNIAFYLTHEESFYFDDGHYERMTLGVGYALDFRAEATKRMDEHSAVYVLKGRKMHLPLRREVLPALLPIYTTDGIPGIPFMLTVDSLRAKTWIRAAKDERDDKDPAHAPEPSQFAKEVCRAIAYWLNEMCEDLNALLGGEAYEPVVVVIRVGSEDEATELLYAQESTDGTLQPISYGIEGRKLVLNLDEHFYHSLHRKDNRGEQNLMYAVLLGWLEILNYSEADVSGARRRATMIVDRHAPLGRKKKLLVRLTNDDIRLNPTNVKGVRKLYRHEVNRQIDQLAVKLSKSPYRPKNNLPPEEKKVLLGKVVDEFYAGLREVLGRYNQEDMIRKLQMFYESAIQERERRKFEAIPLVECFRHHCDIESGVGEKQKSNASYSVSLRCLLEQVVGERSNGTLSFDIEGLDKAIAFMLNIVNWGSLSDKLWLDIADVEVALLKSGRIGTDKRFETVTMAAFHETKLSEDITDLTQSFDRAFAVRREPSELPKPDDAFESAFLDEFQATFEDFVGIVRVSALLALKCEGSVYFGAAQSLGNEVAAKVGCSEDTVRRMIDRFSLFDRGAIENVKSHGFKAHEFYPWRFGRELSLLRRPFLFLGADKNRLTFGARALFEFHMNLVNLIFEGRWPANSTKMKSFVAQRRDINGKAFNRRAFDLIQGALSNAKVFPEVGIGPGKSLEHDLDIGDIDVLVIDEVRRLVVAVECKDLVLARTPYEMSGELKKFVEGDYSWVKKVQRRETWVKENLENLLQQHGILDVSDYVAECIFLTSEAIPLPFVKKNLISYRFLTVYDLRQEIGRLFTK